MQGIVSVSRAVPRAEDAEQVNLLQIDCLLKQSC